LASGVAVSADSLAPFGVQSSAGVRAGREQWLVDANEVGWDGLLAPSVLVSRAIASAQRLAEPVASLSAVSIEHFEVVAPIREGAQLVVTTALERERADLVLVSVVIRKGEAGRGGGVAALGTLRLERTSSVSQALRGVAQGSSPIELRFPARLAEGALFGRVHEASLVSAQGFIGGPVAFVGVPSLSLLAPEIAGHTLVARCSVVHAGGTRLVVLGQVVDEDDGRDVLCSLLEFRSSARTRAGRAFNLLRAAS
jgi:hypothetical protein